LLAALKTDQTGKAHWPNKFGLWRLSVGSYALAIFKHKYQKLCTECVCIHSLLYLYIASLRRYRKQEIPRLAF